MTDAFDRALAIVGVSGILPDAPDVSRFWENVKQGRYSIREIPPGRWNPVLYYDPDPATPDRTYSKIGAWVSDWEKRLPMVSMSLTRRLIKSPVP